MRQASRMRWWQKTILAAVIYAGLLGLVLFLRQVIWSTFFTVLFWVFLSPLLLVLFVVVLTLALISIPIRYKIDAVTGAGRHTLHAKFSYLLGLVRGGYIYQDGKGQRTLYIAWFNLAKKEEPKPTGETDAEGSQTVTKLLSVLEKVSGPGDETPQSVTKEVPSPAKLAKPAPPKAQKQAKKDHDHKEHVPWKEKYAKFKAMKDQVLNYPNRRAVTALVLGAVKKIFKRLKPKHLDIFGTIGFADPSQTGTFLGVYECAASLLKIRNNVRLGGNFETDTTAMDLQAHVKGSINTMRILLPILGLWLKKPIRILVKDLRRKGD